MGNGTTHQVDRFADVDPELLEGLTVGPSQDFLVWLVGHLGRRLGVSWVSVGELHGEDWTLVRTLAAWCDGEPREGDVYVLEGTPCARVIDGGTYVARRGVAERFGEDEFLKGYVGYAGIRLRDSTGRPLGLIAVLDRGELGDPDAIVEVLETFRDRVSANLEARRAVRELRLILEGTSRLSSEDVFRGLVKNLARAMHVKMAMIAERIPGSADQARMLAVCVDGEIQPNFEYEIPRTPCSGAYAGEVVVIKDGVCDLYPENDKLKGLAAQAYVGVPLFDRGPRPVGVLGVFHDHPLHSEIHRNSLFRVLAACAGAELRRRLAEGRRKAAERELLEAQKMESLGVLAGGIAHDFNNLLVGILGNASLARKTAAGVPGMAVSLAEIERSAQRAADLAQQMLAYSGKGALSMASFDLNHLVEEMANLLQVSIPKKVVLRFDLAPDLPRITADGTQIRQVVMNLVLNAAEAIGNASGVVSLSTSCVQADDGTLGRMLLARTAAEGEFVVLEVTDSGCGMEPETRARMFDPFFTTKFTGRGLGLSAVQGIVRSHAGALDVHSEEGRGTTFRLLLPVSGDPAPDEGVVPGVDPTWRGSGLALVVDDEETVRTASQRILESLGFDVRLARDGLEAVDLLRREPDAYRVVLLDLTMPRMDGIETLHALAEQASTVPVVLMTGYNRREASERFADVTLAGFVQKPFTVEDIQREMQRALDPA